jgi:hypothetical protein
VRLLIQVARHIHFSSTFVDGIMFNYNV